MEQAAVSDLERDAQLQPQPQPGLSMLAQPQPQSQSQLQPVLPILAQPRPQPLQPQPGLPMLALPRPQQQPVSPIQLAAAPAVAVTAQPQQLVQHPQPGWDSATSAQGPQGVLEAARMTAPGSPQATQGVQPSKGLQHSTQAMARPFASLVGSVERQKMDMHRIAVERAPYVYVPGYGVMPVVTPAGQPLGFQHAASAAGGSAAGGSAAGGNALPVATFQQSLSEASAAVVPHGVQALEAGGNSSRALPQLRRLRSLHQFWELWHNGDSLAGKSPIKDLAPEERNKKKQRFSEWKRAAEEIESMLAAAPRTFSPAAAAQKLLNELETQRIADKQSVCAFIKALGKRKSS